MIDSSQIRAARALLAWRQDDLARASGVGLATIQRFEKGDGSITTNISTMLRLEETLKHAGVSFIGSDRTGGVGVRLAKPDRGKKQSKVRANP